MIRIAQEDVWGDRWESWRAVLQSALRRVVERTSLSLSSPSHCCLAQNSEIYVAHYASARKAMHTGTVEGEWDAKDEEDDENSNVDIELELEL
jgi:hypothetical protein